VGIQAKYPINHNDNSVSFSLFGGHLFRFGAIMWFLFAFFTPQSALGQTDTSKVKFKVKNSGAADPNNNKSSNLDLEDPLHLEWKYNPKTNRYLKTNKPSDIKIDIYSFNFEVFNDNLRVWYNENSKQFTHEGEFCFSYKKGDDYGYLDFPKEVIEEVNICQKCFGTGILDSGPSCSMPASECCGGCYEQVDCECETPFYVG
jgi:hypothetical protein